VVYIDPPYAIRYGSNFQPFVNKAYRGTASLPFSAGDHRRAAVKIIDDRRIESLKVIGLGT